MGELKHKGSSYISQTSPGIYLFPSTRDALLEIWTGQYKDHVVNTNNLIIEESMSIFEV